MATTHGSPTTTHATAQGLFMAPIQVPSIPCPRPGCTFSASAQSEGRAIRELAHHLVSVHVKGDTDGR